MENIENIVVDTPNIKPVGATAIIGTLTIELHDANGNLKDKREIENIIVADGLAHIASRMNGTSQNVMGYIGIGTTNTAAVVGDTALLAEVARVATTPTIVTTTQTNDTVQHVGTVSAGTGTGAIVEAALFNAASVGTMLNRIVFAVVNKGASDALTLTWKVKIA